MTSTLLFGGCASSTAEDDSSVDDTSVEDSAPLGVAPADEGDGGGGGIGDGPDEGLGDDGGDGLGEGGSDGIGDGLGDGGSAGLRGAVANPTSDSVALAGRSDRGRLFQLTSGGCCTQPFFSPDGERVMFIDRPSAETPVGIYAASIASPLDEPVLASESIGYYLGDLEIRQVLDANTTTLERVADGTRWTLPTGGRPVVGAPDLRRVAWSAAPDTPIERRITTVWVANIDGSEAREVTRLPRGALHGFVDSERLLVRGREALESTEDVLWVVDIASGERKEIARAERLRDAVMAPGGAHVAWFVSQAEDGLPNGLYVAALDGEYSAPRRLDVPFGAWRWRDGQRLLIVPLESGADSMRLIQHDVLSGTAVELTPGESSFKIAAGDWTVSPTGRHLAFVSAGDRNVWLIELPPSP